MTLLHRRADLRETMSDYLIHELERYGVAVRDRSEIAELHGEDGELDAVTLKNGERLPLSFLFLFLGALPCTDWLGDVVARDEHGFVLTGAEAGAECLLETSVPGVFAAGDVRSGSTKRCATAVGEGAMAVAARPPAARSAGGDGSSRLSDRRLQAAGGVQVVAGPEDPPRRVHAAAVGVGKAGRDDVRRAGRLRSRPPPSGSGIRPTPPSAAAKISYQPTTPELDAAELGPDVGVAVGERDRRAATGRPRHRLRPGARARR